MGTPDTPQLFIFPPFRPWCTCFPPGGKPVGHPHPSRRKPPSSGHRTLPLCASYGQLDLQGAQGPCSLTWSVSILSAFPVRFTWSYTWRLWRRQGHWGWRHDGVTWTLIFPGARSRKGQGGVQEWFLGVPLPPPSLSGAHTKKKRDTPTGKLTSGPQSSRAGKVL